MSSPWFPVKLPRTFRFLSILISAFPLELVPCLFLCGFLRMILSVTRKKSAGILSVAINPSATLLCSRAESCLERSRMARIFDAVTGKICRKDVRKKMRNRLFKQAVSLLYDISTKDFVKPAERTKIFLAAKTASHKLLYEAVYGLFRLFTVRKPPELLLQAADRFCCWDCHNPPFPRRLPLPHPA